MIQGLQTRTRGARIVRMLLRRLEAFVDHLRATQDEPVSLHGETDQRYAGFAFKYLKPADYQALGFEQSCEPSAFTRLQARQAAAYLYEKRKLKEAA